MFRPGVPFSPILPTVWARTAHTRAARTNQDRKRKSEISREKRRGEREGGGGQNRRDALPGTSAQPNPPCSTGAVANSFQTRTIAPASPRNASRSEALPNPSDAA